MKYAVLETNHCHESPKTVVEICNWRLSKEPTDRLSVEVCALELTIRRSGPRCMEGRFSQQRGLIDGPFSQQQ